MEIVNIHQAKTHLSRLIAKAAAGEPFIIANAGKPMVKVVAVDSSKKKSRLGGYTGKKFEIPADFDTMCQDEIIRLFHGEDE